MKPSIQRVVCVAAVAHISLQVEAYGSEYALQPEHAVRSQFQSERPNMPYAPWSPNTAGGGMEHCGPWVFGNHASIQVNVDGNGCNIVGDAANEPSLAFNPTNPNNVVVGWRQFDTIGSDFRQAGHAYSFDGGASWTFPGSLAPGTFHSDPVLQSDSAGNFYYVGVNAPLRSDLFRSFDGGITWDGPIPAFGGDKHWMVVDKTGSVGDGNIYSAWSPFAGCCGLNIFSRSTDGGESYINPVAVLGDPFFGTLAVDLDGVVYVAGNSGLGVTVARSANARHAAEVPSFEGESFVDLQGYFIGGEPNPGGLLGQTWIVADHSTGASQGNLYVLESVIPFCCLGDPMDVKLARSTDGGLTWHPSVRVNDDPAHSNAWQWFGALSIAPNGRLDAVWYDTRALFSPRMSQLYYSYSHDAGETWSVNQPVSAIFDTWIGWPAGQNKIGDYIHAVSDNAGVMVAYSATFNGEQDVYFLRAFADDCNSNGVVDAIDIQSGSSLDCNQDGIPDECNQDCNGNGVPDDCDVASQTSQDCNANMIPDECERDFDDDGLIDSCDPDIDNDGVANGADACEYSAVGAAIRADGSTIGDVDSDCDVDLDDYSALRHCINLGGPNDPVPGGCTTRFDVDADSDVDLADSANFQIAFSGP